MTESKKKAGAKGVKQRRKTNKKEDLQRQAWGAPERKTSEGTRKERGAFSATGTVLPERVGKGNGL